MEPEIYPGHILDLLGSRDVIGHYACPVSRDL